MYRAFSILYYLILFVLLSKFSFCGTCMNHMRDTGCTLLVYYKVRHDPMEIMKRESHMKKEKSLFTKEHNNIRNVIASLWHL